MSLTNTLFVSLSVSAQAWYRCALPANTLGEDWIGVVKGPPGKGGIIVGGNIATNTVELDSYENIVIQMVGGEDWDEFIKERQSLGQKVYYEVDDFYHGVRRVKGHVNAGEFRKEVVKKYQKTMQSCDGIICSTEFLADQYSKYGESFVCQNGLDTWRYNVKSPEMDGIVIGWSGGTGHHSSVVPALKAVNSLMDIDDRIIFACAGESFANAMAQIHGEDRCITIPWTNLENYPYVISMFDISIAPGHDSKYHKSKSDLRWLEASAVGVPVVGDKRIYHELEDGETGIYAESDIEYYDSLLYLTEPESGEARRREMGDKAKNYVKKNRDIVIVSKQWENVLSS